MSLDFQVVYPQESIQLSRVTPVQSSSSRILDVIGANFESVEEVLINQVPSDDVIVISKTRLLAQIPDHISTDHVITISVLSRRLVVTPKSFLRFKIGRTPGTVRGILKLVQTFLRILFTVPGKDVFAPRLGGAALKNLGSTFGADEGDDIVSSFIISVDTTQRQLVAIQSRNSRLPRDERLLSAKVIRAGFNKAEGALVVAVEINSQAGRSAVANLVV